MTRYLGIDYGTKRVGLAISDGLGLTARPLDVVARSELLTALGRAVEENDVRTVVVGLPTGLGGGEGSAVEGAREMADQIRAEHDVDVVFVDERFTSRIAESALLESGMKRGRRRENVDKVAAAIILQTYLDGLARGGNHADSSGVQDSDRDDT